MTDSRGHRRSPPSIRSVPVLALLGVCVFLAGTSLTLFARTESTRADVATVEAKALADPIQELCARGDEVSRLLATEGRCALADAVLDQPAKTEPPARIPRAEIARLVEQEVSKLSLPPGQAPNAGQLQEAARRVIEQNPALYQGPPGQPPSSAELADAVAAYFEANPPPRGPAGRDGKDGSDGSSGAPPVGWVTSHSDGGVETCERVTEFDPDQPRYSCTRTAPPPAEQDPPPTGGGDLLPGG